MQGGGRGLTSRAWPSEAARSHGRVFSRMETTWDSCLKEAAWRVAWGEARALCLAHALLLGQRWGSHRGEQRGRSWKARQSSRVTQQFHSET